MRSVAAERSEPMSSASPIPCATIASPSLDQRSHQQFADLGVRLNEAMHLVTSQLDDFTRFTDADTHLRGAAEDHADVTGELSGTENGDQQVAQPGRANDLDLAGLQHKERHVVLTAVDQHLSASDGTRHPLRGNSRDLSRRQRRKHERRIRSARERDGTSGLGQHVTRLSRAFTNRRVRAG